VVAGGFGVLCLVLFLGFLAVAIVLAVYGARKERERKDTLVQWALANEWAHMVRPATDWPTRLPGHNGRGVTMAMTGLVNGWTVTVGEYHYTTSSTDANGHSSSTTHHYVVVALRLPRAYPSIAVSPRGGMSKLWRSVFGDSGATTGIPQFDETFKINTKDPAAVRYAVGPALVEAHLAGRVPAWSIVGDELLTAFQGRITDPTKVPGWAASLVLVAQLMGR
jgi:hypothetical protein